MMRCFLGTCVFLTVAGSPALEAQCPDGSPPPCRSLVRPDTNAFVVIPFAVSGPPAVQYLGGSMVDLLQMALDGVGRMRIEYAPTNLRRLSQMSGSRDARAAASTALEMGAARVITGSVVVVGSDVRIRAEVFDALRNRTQFVVEGRATLDNLTAVVDSLASQILARRLVPPAERNRLSVGEYATRSPSALQAYLLAKHHTRRGERRVAVDSVKAALRHDPHFGLAHYLLYRLEGAQNTITGLTQAAILTAALEHKERFPERLRLLLEDAASVQGDRVGALAQAEALAVRFPADGDVAYRLADTYFHSGLNMGETYDRVIAAFRRALAFDDQDPELTQHFEVLMQELGDSAAARAAWERCHTVAPTVCASDVHFRAIFRREDPLVLASGADSLAWGGPGNSMLRATPWDPAFGLAVTDSFAQIQSRPSRTRQRRATAYLVRSTVALARGQYDAAGAYLDTAASFGAPGTPVSGLQMLHHIVTGAHDTEAQAVRISDRTFFQLSTRAWWAAARQPTDSVEPLLRELEAQPWPDSAKGVAIATGLRGIVALRLGDTSRALDLLKRVRSNHKRGPIPGVIFMPGAALALTLAQLEAARGNPATARLYLADLYPLNDYTPFIGDVEELRSRVTLALGDTAAAKTHLKNVIAVWGKADPPLQPRVTAARTLLARLEGR